MAVHYEWVVELVEEVDPALAGLNLEEDIVDVDHADTYAEALRLAADPENGFRYEIGLVRDDDNGRSWAYVENGVLPENFYDAYDRPVAKVPQRFFREVAKA